MLNAHRVCVVAAHPDDEILGCGGTMAKLRAGGAELRVVFLTDGVGARTEQHDPGARMMMARAAAEAIGGAELVQGPFPDNALDGVPLLEVVQHLERGLAGWRPDTIITHHPADLNIDHAIAHRAVMTACRPLPGQSVKTLLAMEVPSASEWSSSPPSLRFQPALFVDISQHVEQKRAALAAYRSELRPFPHARSMAALEAQMTWRGASAGVPLAEAFEVLRLLR